MASSSNNQIRMLADAMQGLADSVESENRCIRISQLVEACRLFDLEKFGFGSDIKFVTVDISSKVEDLEKKARQNDTVQSVVERDIEQGIVKQDTGPSRTLYRLKRMIEMAMVIFEQLLADNGTKSLADAIITAYGQVFAPYHGPIVRQAVSSAMRTGIPPSSTALNVLNENVESVQQPLGKYATATRIVVNHIESVFRSNESSAELMNLI